MQQQFFFCCYLLSAFQYLQVTDPEEKNAVEILNDLGFTEVTASDLSQDAEGASALVGDATTDKE